MIELTHLKYFISDTWYTLTLKKNAAGGGNESFYPTPVLCPNDVSSLLQLLLREKEETQHAAASKRPADDAMHNDFCM